MMYRHFKLADFCHIVGESSCTINGITTNHHTCKEHGPIHLVRFYGMANGPLVWTCPQCLEDHLGKALTHAEETIQHCYMCKEVNNLAWCEMCGDAICPTHNVEGCCEECARGIDEFCGRGYSCV